MPGIDRERIRAAARLIAPHIRVTPMLRLEGRELALDCGPLALKLESLQHSGSFKARGAFMSLLSRAVPAAGAAAASGGNHGAAVAYAARALGHKARIFVPAISSPAKIERIQSYGAELVVGGERYIDALQSCERYVAETGALQVHAYDQEETLLGQGTLGAEIEAEAPDINTLLVAVGGGGLIGGIAAWFEGRVRVIGVEPELAPTLAMALEAGRPVDAPGSGIAADSLAPRQVGQLMFPIAARAVDRVVLVADEAIHAAQVRLWEALRIVAEPGGAAALAALLSGSYRPAKGERVAVLVCGGNTTAVDFSH